MKGDDEQMVDELVATFPILEDSYSSHVYNEGGVLPHVFFWDVVQDVVSSFTARDPGALDWRAVLAFLERQMQREVPEVNEVICTSFLGYLPYPGDPGHELIDYLGPIMSRKFKEMRPRG